MKCIYCANDAKYADRQDGNCPKCKRGFALEPKKGDQLTDAAFKAAIARVSSEGTVRWTKDHLYYEVARRTGRNGKTAMGVLGVFGAIAAIIAAAAQSPLFALAAVLWWILAGIVAPRATVQLDPKAFDSMWQRWLKAHGEPPALIVRKALPAPGASRPLPSDIEEYSFDRAVITDRAETVDLLLANNFHFENNCAVLAVDGYPKHVFETVRAMLKKNPRLVVYVLHDATVAGCLVAQRLASSPEWFQGGARVIDVGLRPEHAGPFKGCWRPQEGFSGPSPSLSDAENRWLSRYALELSVIRPEQVIKRLFRAISSTSEIPLVADGVGGYYVDAGAFSADASASDGGGDSFG